MEIRLGLGLRVVNRDLLRVDLGDIGRLLLVVVARLDLPDAEEIVLGVAALVLRRHDQLEALVRRYHAVEPGFYLSVGQFNIEKIVLFHACRTNLPQARQILRWISGKSDPFDRARHSMRDLWIHRSEAVASVGDKDAIILQFKPNIGAQWLKRLNLHRSQVRTYLERQRIVVPHHIVERVPVVEQDDVDQCR